MDEIAKNTAARAASQNSAEYEYNTLMRLLGASVSKHLIDEHFTLIWANEFYYNLIGWPKDEYEAKFHNRPDLYYANDKDIWDGLTATVVDAVANGRTGYQLVSRMPLKSGGYVWVQFSTQFSDEYVDGHRVAYTVITNIDNLVRIQREQSVTYESLPGFVAKYKINRDFSMELQGGNSRFMEYFGEGSDTDSLYQRNIFANMDVILEYRAALLAGESVHFVMHVKDRDGRDMWLQVNATCTDTIDGCPVYLVIFIDITDVTELRQMQKKLTEQATALKDALTVAEQANRAKSDFLSRMSHEIRTPMNAVIGMTAIAAAYIDDKDRVKDCLEKIGYSSKHLLTLINDVLDMSKIDAGKLTFAREKFELEKVIEAVTSIIYPQALAKGLAFTVPIVGMIETELIGDSMRLNQILLNLLSNAVKFTPEGGAVRLEIRQLRRAKGKARLRFTVSDTGIGMNEKFIEHIFMPFEQESTDTARKFGGTGLGMPITKNLVTLMGGAIAVKSEPDKGSEFTVELDFDLPDTSGVRELKFNAMESLKVLIADDDRSCCVHASLLLENLGIRSDWVLTGGECVDKVRDAHAVAEDYDVCFVDWKMPDIDGIEVTRRIREIAGPDTTVVIITAYDLSMIEKSGREAGADAFLAKPLFASTVYNTLLSVSGLEKEKLVPMASGSDRRGELAGRHVLLAEDNDLNREIAVELLKMADVTVDAAVNGKEAVDKFIGDGDAYDLILMDVQMPVMDGYQATESIRRSGLPRAGTIPILAMTADAFHENVVRALEAGMNGHLAKPIDPEQLYRALSDALKKK